MAAHPEPRDPRAARTAAYGVAHDIERLCRRIVYEARLAARAASRGAMTAELRLAEQQGAGDMPTLAPLDTNAADRRAADEVARSYASAWLDAALQAIDDAERLRQSQQRDGVPA